MENSRKSIVNVKVSEKREKREMERSYWSEGGRKRCYWSIFEGKGVEGV